MEEKVGYCECCQREVYCKSGFIDGVVTERKKIYCFTCYERKEEENKKV